MAEFPALPLWTDAYLGDTRHLTTTEHGAYLLLLIAAWRRRDTNLPDDDRQLARFAGLTAHQWARIKPVIRDFFEVQDGVWTQRRLTDEACSVRQRRAAQAKAGRLSALKRKGRHVTEREVSDSEASTPTTTPTPTPIKKKEVDAAAKRGSRLADDFVVPDAWIQWATAEAGLDPAAARREAATFVDFWRAKAGRDAVKVDWLATWRVWCRKALPAQPSRVAASTAAEDAALARRLRLQRYREMDEANGRPH